MVLDHYATLGVAWHADRARIRTAYLELMRRYHPDQNPSPSAAAQAQAITAAYAVLSDPSRRSSYDAQWRASRVSKLPGQLSESGPAKHASFRRAPVLGLTLMASVLLLVAWQSTEPLTISPERVSSLPDVDENDGRGKGALLEPTAASKADEACSRLDASLLKRELFARTARLRGSADAAMKNIASHSSLRMGSLLFTDTAFESYPCAVSLIITLPFGLEAPGGRRVLMGEVAYTSGMPGKIGPISPALLEQLAAVERKARNADNGILAPAPPGRGSIYEERTFSERNPIETVPIAKPPRPVSNERRIAGVQSPSFICSSSNSWAANAICSKGELAELDRRMASLYGDSLEQAEPSQRALLSRSDSQFLASRDQCRSEECVRAVYQGRIAQIRSLMAKDANSPRP